MHHIVNSRFRRARTFCSLVAYLFRKELPRAFAGMSVVVFLCVALLPLMRVGGRPLIMESADITRNADALLMSSCGDTCSQVLVCLLQIQRAYAHLCIGVARPLGNARN